MTDTDDPSSTSPVQNGLSDNNAHTPNAQGRDDSSLTNWLKSLLGQKSGSGNLREAIEEYIEELDGDETHSIAAHERVLISNVLKLKDMTVTDVMIPRADIVGIDINATHSELFSLLAEKQYSRLPVYREHLDDIVGTIHIKDILAHMASRKDINIPSLVRNVPIISPSVGVLDLLLEMRQTKKHMMLVIDEFGGIDGLITIGDVIESIVGEIDDEFDQDDQPQIEEKNDGSIIADARVDIEDFEERYGRFLEEDEREDIDTLAGLAFSIAGRVPARGEVLKHSSGIILEIMEADSRRISSLRIKNLPENNQDS